MQENVYENASGSGVGGAGVGAAGAGAGGAAQWWWRACRRRALASQTLEFNERPGRAGRCEPRQPDMRLAGTMPRALRPACGTTLGVRLSSSCGTIDLPLELPPCMLLVQRWAPRPPPPSCSYHLLPESQRTLPHHQHLHRHRRLAGPGQGDREPCCSPEDEVDDEGGEEPRAEGELCLRPRTPTPEPPPPAPPPAPPAAPPPPPVAPPPPPVAPPPPPADLSDETREQQPSSSGKYTS